MSQKSQTVCSSLGLVPIVICLATSVVAQEVKTKISKPLDALRKPYDEATAAWENKYSGQPGTPAAQLIERYDNWPTWSFLPRIVELGTKDPDAPYAFDALKWFVELSRG